MFRISGFGFRIFLGGMLALFCACPAVGAEFGNLSINPKAVLSGNPLHGYTDHAITVTNNSAERTHRVRLTLPKRSFGSMGGGNHLRQTSRTVDVGPGATVTVSLLQPPIPYWGDGIGVTIDGREQDETLPLLRRTPMGMRRFPGSGGVSTGRPHPFVYLSRSLSTDFQDQADKVLAPMAGMLAPTMGRAAMGSGGFVPAPPPVAVPKPPPSSTIITGGPSGTVRAEVDFVRAEDGLAGWSTNWLSYTGYDGLAVTDADLRGAPAAVQTALFQYLEAGGTLLIVGDFKPPDHWLAKKQIKEGVTSYYPIFGHCIVVSERDSAKWGRKEWGQLMEAWRVSATPFERVRDVGDANSAFPVVENISIPVTGLTIIMVIFAFIIGPVNLFVLTRIKRLIWILWTIPVISLFTCVAVFGYATFGEGWRGNLRTETLTILDEHAHRATTIGWTGFYAPLTPGDGLRFSNSTELLPQVADSGSDFGRARHRYAAGTARTLDWSHDQHLNSGWATARVPAHFAVRKTEVRRERVTLRRRANGNIDIVNGLGADIQDFWLAEKDGKIYHVAEVPAGQEATLKLADLQIKSSDPSELRLAFSNDWIVTVAWTGDQTGFARNPEKYLRPGCYIATMNDAPFLEDGLENTKARKCRSVVYGILKEGEQE